MPALLVAGLAVCASAEPVAPRMVCDAPAFHFGIVTNQETVKHTFVLRNGGGAALAITRVSPSCGCVVPVLDRKELQPGERSEVNASFSLRGRHGSQRKCIRIHSNDPARPILELWIEGEIAAGPDFGPGDIRIDMPAPAEVTAAALPVAPVPAIRVMPPLLLLPAGETTVARTIWLRSGISETFEVREVRCPVAGVQTKLITLGPGTYRIDVGGIPVGEAVRGRAVTITTSSAGMPQIVVPFELGTNAPLAAGHHP
jgi:hypothetical protein